MLETDDPQVTLISGEPVWKVTLTFLKLSVLDTRTLRIIVNHMARMGDRWH
jgi:hypothetical protein